MLGGSRKGSAASSSHVTTLSCTQAMVCRALVGEGIAANRHLGLGWTGWTSTLQKRWCSVVEVFAGVAS